VGLLARGYAFDAPSNGRCIQLNPASRLLIQDLTAFASLTGRTIGFGLGGSVGAGTRVCKVVDWSCRESQLGMVSDRPEAFVPMTECVFQSSIEHMNANV
jgi:hypothetical protein